jgi:hypothetical protein
MRRKYVVSKKHPHAVLKPVLPQTITLPHINYKLRVVWAKPADLLKTRLPRTEAAGAFFRNMGHDSSEIHLGKDAMPALVVHEIIHVLQHIVEERGALIEEEREHMAYVAQYIFNRIYGIRYEHTVRADR